MTRFPGGTPHTGTRCLICRCRQKDGFNWTYLEPGKEPGQIFAGYFCSESCKTVWNLADEEERLNLIFGDAETGIELKAKVERGELTVQTEADPEGAMEFERIDRVADAAVWERDGKNQLVPTGKIARWRFIGFRAPKPGHSGRAW